MQQNQLVILLHSSKTMRNTDGPSGLKEPVFLEEASELANYLKKLSPSELETAMHISKALAEKTKTTIEDWRPEGQTAAIDSFIGDIYSGLRAQEFSASDREYADRTLWILSGLYGFLRPNDAICPYRLEMGYRFADPRFRTLYGYWGKKIAEQLPEQGTIVNVSSVEYTKAVLPFVDPTRVMTPNFLTIDPKTGTPKFTAVHAKIARGAFARWLITSRITDPARFHEFSDLGYTYDESLSTPQTPAFVCQTFEGLGLSIRLQ
jgi:cytoplasmic iron level regulating protein YaaA (DUF328/UPF0246 family)